MSSSSSGTAGVQDGPPPPRVEASRVCLFCYKTVITSREEEDVGRFLTLLGRFMGEEDVLQKFCGGRERKGIGCCGDCGSIVTSFSVAYHQLKCLELRLEWKLGTLVNLMRFANKVPSRMEGLRRLILEGTGDSGVGRDWEEDGDMIEAESMDRKISNFKALRTKLIRSCSRKLSRSQPRVCLERKKESSHPDASFTAALVKTETPTVASASIKIDTTDPAPTSSILAECFLGWSMSFAAVTILASLTTQPEVETSSYRSSLPNTTPPSIIQLDMDGDRSSTPSFQFEAETVPNSENNTEGEGVNGHGVFREPESGNEQPPLNSTPAAKGFRSGCSATGGTNKAVPHVEESTDSMNPSEEMLETVEESPTPAPAFEPEESTNLDSCQDENLDFVPVSRNTIKAILLAIPSRSEVQSLPLIDLESENWEGPVEAATDVHDSGVNAAGGDADDNACGQVVSETEEPIQSTPAVEEVSTPNSPKDTSAVSVTNGDTPLLGYDGGPSLPQDSAFAVEAPSDRVSKSAGAPSDTKTGTTDLPQSRGCSFHERRKRSFMEMEKDTDFQDGDEYHASPRPGHSVSLYFSSNARPIKASVTTQPEVATKSLENHPLPSPNKTSPLPPVDHLNEDGGRSSATAFEFDADTVPNSRNVEEIGTVLRTKPLASQVQTCPLVDLESENPEEVLEVVTDDHDVLDTSQKSTEGDAGHDASGQPKSVNEKPPLKSNPAAETFGSDCSAIGGTNEAIPPVEEITDSLNPSEEMLGTEERPSSRSPVKDCTNSGSHQEKNQDFVPIPRKSGEEIEIIFSATPLPGEVQSLLLVDLESGSRSREESMDAHYSGVHSQSSRRGEAGNDFDGQSKSDNEEPPSIITPGAEVSRSSSSTIGGIIQAFAPVEEPKRALNPNDEISGRNEEPSPAAPALESEDSSQDENLDIVPISRKTIEAVVCAIQLPTEVLNEEAPSDRISPDAPVGSKELPESQRYSFLEKRKSSYVGMEEDTDSQDDDDYVASPNSDHNSSFSSHGEESAGNLEYSTQTVITDANESSDCSARVAVQRQQDISTQLKSRNVEPLLNRTLSTGDITPLESTSPHEIQAENDTLNDTEEAPPATPGSPGILIQIQHSKLQENRRSIWKLADDTESSSSSSSDDDDSSGTEDEVEVITLSDEDEVIAISDDEDDKPTNKGRTTGASANRDKDASEKEEAVPLQKPGTSGIPLIQNPSSRESRKCSVMEMEGETDPKDGDDCQFLQSNSKPSSSSSSGDDDNSGAAYEAEVITVSGDDTPRKKGRPAGTSKNCDKDASDKEKAVPAPKPGTSKLSQSQGSSSPKTRKRSISIEEIEEEAGPRDEDDNQVSFLSSSSSSDEDSSGAPEEEITDHDDDGKPRNGVNLGGMVILCDICQRPISEKKYEEHWKQLHDKSDGYIENIFECPLGSCSAYFVDRGDEDYLYENVAKHNRKVHKPILEVFEEIAANDEKRPPKERRKTTRQPDAVTTTTEGLDDSERSRGDLSVVKRKNRKKRLKFVTIHCDLCPAICCDGQQFQTHQFKIHFKKECPKCGKFFTLHCHLKTHLEQKHPEFRIFSSSTFICDIGKCRKQFPSEAMLEWHKKTFKRHYAQEREMVKCDICHKECLGKRELSSRKRSAHPHQVSLLCSECGAHFNGKRNLEVHMLYHQSSERWKFQCSRCGEKFPEKLKLRLHQRTHV